MARTGSEHDPPHDAKEAAVVDQLLRKLRPAGPGVLGPAGRAGGDFRGGGPRAMDTRRLSRPLPAPSEPPPAWTWARVGLGVLLGAALTQWPYERACGWWLSLYLTAVAIVIVTGLWGALFAWHCRLGLAHVIALGTILWGLALGAHEVLPRIGYARAEAGWRCADLRAMPVGGSLRSERPS